MTTETLRRVVYERPPLYPAQEAAIFCSERWGVVEASSKSGKTVGCICWLHEQAALSGPDLRTLGQPGVGGGPGHNFWWVAPVYSQARVAFRRLKRFLPEGTFESNATEQTVTLGNGSVLWFKSGEHPDALYGEDVYAAVVDEASRCKPDAWVAVRTTLTATGGPARIIGNVKGSRNWAYRLARRAEAGEPDMHFARLTVWDAIKAGIFSVEEADDARKHMTEAEFRELYEAEAADEDDQFFFVERLGLVEAADPTARMARAWDFAVTPNSKSGNPDYTVGAKLAWDGRRLAIVDIVKRRDSPDRIVDLVSKTAEKDGRLCDQVFEEEKGASGKMMVESLRRMLRGVPEAGRVFAAPLTGDKRARAFMLASRINQGDAVMVDARWNREFSDQLDSFPDGDHDDMVDAAAHAYNHMTPRLGRPGRVRLPGS